MKNLEWSFAFALLGSAVGAWHASAQVASPTVGASSVFVPVPPCRIVDTRKPSPSPIAAGTTRSFSVVGITDYSAQGGAPSSCGIPGVTADGVRQVTAIAANVVAATPAAQGNLVAFPSDITAPAASTINFPGSSVPLNIANAVIIPVAQTNVASGDVLVDISVKPTQTTHVVIDVTGYFTPLPIKSQLNVTSPDLIGGLAGNTVAAGVVGAIIAGGGDPGSGGYYGPEVNQVTGNFGVVSGGRGNVAGLDSVVAGGNSSTAGGGGAVAGGFGNFAQAGGAVGGGSNNSATGTNATIPGGSSNQASGTLSFAAGAAAQALHDFSFVLSDSHGQTSSATNQFNARFAGGFRFFTDTGDNNGCSLGPNAPNLVCAGTITAGSDRNAKEHFVPIDPLGTLETVAHLPVSRWNFIADGANVQHIGPMAQDFYAAFKTGPDDKHISTVDADGVAIAAIQGLYQMIQEDRVVIHEKDAKIADLERLVTSERERGAEIQLLEARLASLENQMAANHSTGAHVVSIR